MAQGVLKFQNSDEYRLYRNTGPCIFRWIGWEHHYCSIQGKYRFYTRIKRSIYRVEYRINTCFFIRIRALYCQSQVDFGSTDFWNTGSNTGNYGFLVFFSRLCTGLLRDYTGKYGIILVNTGSEYRTKLVPVFVRVSIRVYRLPYFRNSVSCIIPYLHQNTGKYGKLMACINACFMQWITNKMKK